MTKLFLLTLLASAVFFPSVVKAQEPVPSAFSGTAVNSGGVLRLKAADAYLKWKKDARKLAVEAQAKVNPGTAVAVVEHQGNGELWTILDGNASLADSWKRNELHFGPHVRRVGRWFGYAGGQLTRGGDLPSNMWIGRIGTLLLNNRYDAALSVSRNNFTDISESAVTSIGLTFRSLHPFTEHTGYNYGAGLDRISYTGYSHISPTVVAGINIYLPGGSFDVTATQGESGNRGLMLGYTVYLGGRQ